MAYRVVHELKHRLRPGCVPVFSSDGLKHYFYALTAHFGHWERPEGKKRVWTLLGEFAYAQVIKHRRKLCSAICAPQAPHGGRRATVAVGECSEFSGSAQSRVQPQSVVDNSCWDYIRVAKEFTGPER